MPDFLKFTVDKFTFKIAADFWYTLEGVWAKEENGIVRIGLTDFLQQRSGDIAFVEVKPAGSIVRRNDEIATIETIKVDIALSSPAAGKIHQLNPKLELTPEVINQDPYGDGWLCEIEAATWETDRLALRSAADYFDNAKRIAETEIKRE
jgi:glycine cleavage system H protein